MVEDCPHHVYPIQAKRISVFDAKVETLAYDEPKRTLEIAFKNGQTWQFFDVPPDVCNALRDSTISSFLKFIAHRYRSAPVKTGQAAVRVPESEKCAKCEKPMTVRHSNGLGFRAVCAGVMGVRLRCDGVAALWGWVDAGAEGSGGIEPDALLRLNLIQSSSDTLCEFRILQGALRADGEVRVMCRLIP
jgi:hypothetical protein